MAFCKSCGTDIGEAKFCPACGARNETAAEPVNTAPAAAPIFSEPLSTTPETSAPVTPEPVSAPVFAPDPTIYSSANNTTNTVPPAYSAPVYSAPVYSADAAQMPSTTGQMVFGIINIVLGVLSCCNLLNLAGLVLGIIAVVNSNKAGKAGSVDEANQFLHSAKTMNIIAIILNVLGAISWIIILATGVLSDVMSSNSYY
jgi:uncharacterized membrane protein YiaA